MNKAFRKFYGDQERAILGSYLVSSVAGSPTDMEAFWEPSWSLKGAFTAVFLTPRPSPRPPLYLFLVVVVFALTCFLVWRCGAGMARRRRKLLGAAAAPSSSEIREIDDLSKMGDDPSFVLFWSSTCAHCIALKPDYIKTAQEEKSLADFFLCSEGKLAERLEISAYPTVVFLKGRAPVDSLVGNQGKKALKDFVARHVGPKEATAHEKETHLSLWD